MFIVLVVPEAWSGVEAEKEEPHRWLRSISLVSGYGVAPLKKTNSDYEIIPILPQFGFDINPLAEKLHIKPKGFLEFVVEPVMNLIINPSTNAEVGCSFFLKYSQRITSRIAPYVEGGLGMIYASVSTYEQGTKYNFITQAGLGIQFFINEHFALTGGYRFRHLSNADIDKQNKGIDHHFGLVGISYYYK
jgi:hypothetical protein